MESGGERYVQRPAAQTVVRVEQIRPSAAPPRGHFGVYLPRGLFWFSWPALTKLASVNETAAYISVLAFIWGTCVWGIRLSAVCLVPEPFVDGVGGELVVGVGVGVDGLL